LTPGRVTIRRAERTYLCGDGSRQDESMRAATGTGRWTAALLAVVAAVGVVAAGSATATRGSPRSPAIPATARAALLKAALRIATSHGDGHPYDIEAVRTTHQEAERILCGQCESALAPPNAAVYIVALRGHFNCNSCSHPRRVTFKPAGVITLQFVNPRDLQAVVFGYGNVYPHLQAGGTPVRLSAPATTAARPRISLSAPGVKAPPQPGVR
jgi:hypothetical protein